MNITMKTTAFMVPYTGDVPEAWGDPATWGAEDESPGTPLGSGDVAFG